ncbi:MAG: hypothetical protein ACLS70_11945 [[Clostridium] symbiosum]
MGDKMVRTTPVRTADGMMGWFYESFVPGEDCRGVGRRGRLRQLPHQTGHGPFRTRPPGLS